MATYELDDALVHDAVEHIHRSLAVDSPGGRLGAILKNQLPKPVPAGLGAVVRTHLYSVLIRTALDNDRISEWRHPGGDAVSTDQIGRVTEVLREGLPVATPACAAHHPVQHRDGKEL